MKKERKNQLAKIIVLGLVLASWTGSAWAAEVIGVDANGTSETVNQPISVVNSSGRATGLYAHKGGVISTDGDGLTSISSLAGNDLARGIIAETGGAINIAMNGSLTVKLDPASTISNGADGICADGAGAGIVISGLTDLAATSKSHASAIGALNGGKVKVETSGTIDVTATEEVGAAIYGQYKDSAVTVTGLKDIKVRAGTFGIGVQATDRGTALVELSGNMDIVAEQSARAIIAGSFSASNKYKDDYPSITTVIGVGTNPSTISAQGGTYSALLYLDNGGTINVENIMGAEDVDDSTAFAIAAAEEGGIVNMVKTSLSGNVEFDATDSVAGATNELNINIDEDSLLAGATKVINDDSSKNAAININNQGVWGITDNSTLGTLTNNGQVTFVDTKSTPLVLKADTLAGSGLYIINTDLANQSGDTIVAGTSKNANIKIQVISDPVYYTKDWNSVAQKGYQVLSISSGSASVEGEPMDIGAYRVTPNVVSNGTTGWDINGFNVGPSANTMTAADARAVVNEAWLMDTNSLAKRLGDLRLGDTGDDGVWARFQRNNSKMKGDRQAKLNANLFQVGYDRAFSRKDGKSYVGIAVDRIDGNGSYDSGSGDVKATSVALYNTWLGDTGHYYDIVLRQGHYSNDYKMIDLAGMLSKADYGTNATTLSGEYGYRKALKNGAYLEPQAEIIYGHLTGSDYTTSEGGVVNADATNHFITRLGIAAGRQSTWGNYYARASYYHDFAGGGGISFDGYSYERDAAKNWAEITLGGDVKLGKNWKVYGEIAKYFGDIKNSLNYDIGIRWSF